MIVKTHKPVNYSSNTFLSFYKKHVSDKKTLVHFVFSSDNSWNMWFIRQQNKKISDYKLNKNIVLTAVGF